MPTPFPLEIVTLEKVALAEEVERVSLVGGEGGLAIEARHMPLVTNVVPGPVLIRRGGSAPPIEMAVGEGFLLVVPDGASLLVDFAEPADEIDVDRAQAAKDRAEQHLANASPETDVDRAQRALARATARLRVAPRA